MEIIIKYGTYAFFAIITFFVIKLLFSKGIKNYHSRWNKLFEDFKFSPQEFYTLLEQELKNIGFKNITFSTVMLQTSHIFSGRRRYLRIEWKDFQYDICMTTVGKNSLFISWWLLYRDSFGKILVSKIPFIGTRIAQTLYPVTYYTIDTAGIFMGLVQNTVLKVIDDITNDKGVRALTEAERKPILNNIFKR